MPLNKVSYAIKQINQKLCLKQKKVMPLNKVSHVIKQINQKLCH